MSVRAMSEVWSNSKSKNGDLLVLLAIADFANDSFWAWPSIDTLAKKSRLSRRQVVYVLQNLVDLGELLIDENAGQNGVNRYLILLGTKGAISNPPKESDKKEGGAKTARVQKLHSANGHSEFAHKPSGTVTTHTPVEWPSTEEVSKFASEYSGNMAKGIPAVIPEAWVGNYFAWRTFTARDWPADWKQEIIFRFERNWQDGEKRARGSLQTATEGQFSSKQSVSGAPKKNGVWAKKQQLEELKKRAAQHPANENSSANFSEPTEKQIQEFQKLQETIRVCEGEIMEAAA